MKEAVINHPVLEFYDETADIRIIADASNVKLGAACEQSKDAKNWHPIAFASRLLTDVERRYSTSERELLACIFALKEFRPYVYGRRFKLLTDHLALKYLHK